MLVTWRALNGRHLTIAQCAKGEERKHRHLVEEDLREITKRSFDAYGQPLETITSFKYLRRVMTAGEDSWPAVVGKLGKDRKSWVQLTRILVWEGADPRVSNMVFKALVQVVLLLGSETWILTPHMEWSLHSFQHRVSSRITGDTAKDVGGRGAGSIHR